MRKYFPLNFLTQTTEFLCNGPLKIQVHGPFEKGFCDLTIGNTALMEADSGLTMKAIAHVQGQRESLWEAIWEAQHYSFHSS